MSENKKPRIAEILGMEPEKIYYVPGFADDDGCFFQIKIDRFAEDVYCRTFDVNAQHNERWHSIYSGQLCALIQDPSIIRPMKGERLDDKRLYEIEVERDQHATIRIFAKDKNEAYDLAVEAVETGKFAEDAWYLYDGGVFVHEIKAVEPDEKELKG